MRNPLIFNNLFAKTILRFSLVFIVAYCFTFCSTKKNVGEDFGDNFPMEQMIRIEKSIKEPIFKDKIYNILDFGAVADGKTMATTNIKKAIETCSKNGGGKVLIPVGKFLSGAIHLENNVNLYLEEGAEILFSTNPQDFYPLVHTSFEGMEMMNYSPLIYAKNKKNIAITGKGILNGQASNENW